MKRLYVSAPVDEVKLARAVRDDVEGLRGTLPTAQALRERTVTHGSDNATMLLYRAILASPVHREFIDALNAFEPPLETSPAWSPAGAKVVFLPALFHAQYPESGADARFAADIAAACGFETAHVPTASLGTLADNAAILRDFLQQESAPRVWVFAVSKGSAEFRLFLQQHARPEDVARIAGWINVCGLPAGCDIAEYNLATHSRALKYRAICLLLGTRFELLRELSSRHPYWQSPLVVPASMRVFNFMAIPLGCHIQSSMVGRYMAIRNRGPNDGMIACRDSVIEGGPIYPVWGADHFFRSPRVVPLLYCFFAWLRGQ